MAEIRRSYLRLARTSHPDFHHESDRARMSAETQMRKINEAWAVLSDVDARSSYDRERLSGQPRAPFDAGSHGRVDEPDPWTPFDDGPTADFDESDDRAITSSTLPGWLKTIPALGIIFGLASFMIGGLIGVEPISKLGLIAMLLSVLLFAAAPLFALSVSRSEDTRP
jgi:hypothetical protein